MKIRFKTQCGLIAIKECPDIDMPVTVVMSPLWQIPPVPGKPKPENFQCYRRYEFNGEIVEGIPTVVEIHEAP